MRKRISGPAPSASPPPQPGSSTRHMCSFWSRASSPWPAKRMPLYNANQPAEPSLSEADRADMEVFLGHMLGMLPVLGVHAFEQAPKAPAAKASAVLTCKG